MRKFVRGLPSDNVLINGEELDQQQLESKGEDGVQAQDQEVEENDLDGE